MPVKDLKLCSLLMPASVSIWLVERASHLSLFLTLVQPVTLCGDLVSALKTGKSPFLWRIEVQ